MSTTKEYADRIPVEVREAAKSLSSDNHFAVLSLLIQDEGLAFNQIRNEFEDLHQQSLSNILSQLQEGGFVIRKDIVTDLSDYSTQYEVTSLGERVLESLLDAFEPRERNFAVVVEKASGHNFHTQANPYPSNTRTKKKVTSEPLDEASQIGGVQGEKMARL